MEKLICDIVNKAKKNWFKKLLDKNDNSVAISSFIILIVLMVAVLLLLIPAFALIIEAWYNHTVSSDISGWATYIGAVCTLIVTVCGFKWGINNTDKKYPIFKEPEDDNSNELNEESNFQNIE